MYKKQDTKQVNINCIRLYSVQNKTKHMIAKQRMEQTLNSNGNNNDADNDNDISRYLVEWRYSEEQG